MAADQLDRHVAAALERDVAELGAGLLLQRHGDDLILLLGAGAGHLEAARPGRLGRIDVFDRRLVRLVAVDPEDELVQREHRNRRQILPIERHPGRERGGEQVRERDDDLVGIACVGLDVEEALGAGAARLVDDHDRLRHQLMLLDHALDHARHLVGAAAGARRHDELHGLGRLPCDGGARQRRYRHAGARSDCGAEQRASSVLSCAPPDSWLRIPASQPAPDHAGWRMVYHLPEYIGAPPVFKFRPGDPPILTTLRR